MPTNNWYGGSEAPSRACHPQNEGGKVGGAREILSLRTFWNACRLQASFSRCAAPAGPITRDHERACYPD